MLVVVPVSENDAVLGIVGVFFGGWVDEQRGAQTVDVLALDVV